MNRLTTLFVLRGRSDTPTGVNISFGKLRPKQKCPSCGNGWIEDVDWKSIQASIIGEKANNWNDHIGGFQSIVSQKIVDNLADSGLMGYIAHPVTIIGVESEALRMKEHPSYYVLQITGRISMDRQLFDNNEGIWCPTCLHWKPSPGSAFSWGERLTVPIIESWSGDDFVMSKNVGAGRPFCTRRVVDLAREKGWTGFSVEGIPPGLPAIDHLSQTWFEDFNRAAAEKYPALI